jgi:transitional endoplasmic reticulum ATPase
VGATNRPDQIDPALLRGGRLSRTITVPLPDVHARLALLQLFSAKMPLQGVDLGGIAAVTEDWSGGDLRALCQDAALLALVAAREHRETVSVVTEADFERALTQARGASR